MDSFLKVAYTIFTTLFSSGQINKHLERINSMRRNTKTHTENTHHQRREAIKIITFKSREDMTPGESYNWEIKGLLSVNQTQMIRSGNMPGQVGTII